MKLGYSIALSTLLLMIAGCAGEDERQGRQDPGGRDDAAAEHGVPTIGAASSAH